MEIYQPNLNKLKELEQLGLMRSAKHPTLDLTIWNYTSKCQFENYWDENTQNCRGLVTNDAGKVIARPWPKFRNIEEHQYKVPNEPFEVTEKMDGSLGILFSYGTKLIFASRGSFGSDQAIEFQKIWNDKYSHLSSRIKENYTYLFEVIFPENRIVVDYKDKRDICHLSTLDTNTGAELVFGIEPRPGDYPRVKRYYFNSIQEILDSKLDNAEGYVLRFIPSNFRVKVKQTEYCRLHNIVTNASTTSVWEAMMKGDDFSQYLEKVPDEFYIFIKETQKDLEEKYNSIFNLINLLVKNYKFKTNLSRKELALKIQTEVSKEFQGLVFAHYDGKSIKEQIFKMIKPIYQKPFWSSGTDETD